MTFEWTPLAVKDVGKWAELLAAVEAEDRTGDNYSQDDLADDLGLPALDLAEGTGAVWDGDRLVAFGAVYARPVAEPAHRMRLWCAVHPEYRHRGLGGQLMSWAARAARTVHERRFPGFPLELHTQVDDHNEWAKAAVTAAGLMPRRSFYGMRRDLGRPLPTSVMPGGLKVVPYTEDLDEVAVEVRNAAFTDHWGSVPHTQESWRDLIIGTSFSREDSFVVQEESGRSVGLLITHYYEADSEVTGIREAWIQIIATLRDWRGRGVASGLLAHALAEFRARGYQRAGLGVDADNSTGALGVYVRAGFEVDRSATAYVAELSPGG
ncbi:GNAT family N-acetyltransferase [Streptosporangium sp. NPDC051023]|uniref:GNAT family N-acetyltransferase n=1 Tax=Streptosporangium sp. NPDC051023 TaxID=3155410 RepID=UPI00344D440B